MFELTLQAQWKQTETYKKVLGKYVKEFGMEGLTRDMQLDALEFNYGYRGNLFNDELTEAKKKERAKLLEKVFKAHQAIEEIEKGKVYKDAFEWRFEFPEVLDEEGNFVGFDVVIGNPPYIPLNKLKETDYSQFDYQVFDKSGDILSFFFEKGLNLLNKHALMSLITSNSWLKTKYGEVLKNLFTTSGASVQIINFEDTQIFEEATVETCIVTLDRNKDAETTTVNIKKFDAKRATVATLKEAKTMQRLCEKLKRKGGSLRNGIYLSIMVLKQDLTKPLS